MDERSCILLVDDHAILAAPLAMALEPHGFRLMSAVDHGDLTPASVLNTARVFRPSIVLLDMNLGAGRLGISLIAPLREIGARVVVLTASEDPYIISACLRADAEAVFNKAMAFDELVAALVDIAAGREITSADERENLIAALSQHLTDLDARRRAFDALTPREAEILRRLVAGDSPKAIARSSGTSVSTVRNQIKHIFGKLDVSSQREALVLCRAVGWPDS